MPSKYFANSIDKVSLRKHSFTRRDTCRFTAHESGYFFAASGEFFSTHATKGYYRILLTQFITVESWRPYLEDLVNLL